MRVLVDTNVILDHLLERKPFSESAELIFSETEQGRIEALIGGTTVTTIHYIVTKSLGTKVARNAISKLLQLFDVAPITRTVLASALQLKFTDFEDAVLYEAALHAGAEAIITRDIKGFQKAKIAVYSSDEFIISLKNLE